MPKRTVESTPVLMWSSVKKFLESSFSQTVVLEFDDLDTKRAFSVTRKGGDLNIGYWAGDTYRTQTINLTTTTPFFGGTRYWMNCGCGKRVTQLYFANGYFACRGCHDLTYHSQNVTHSGKYQQLYLAGRLLKLMRKSEAIRVQRYKGRLTKRIQRMVDRANQIHEQL